MQIKNWRQIFSNKSCRQEKEKNSLHLNQQCWRLLIVHREAWRRTVSQENKGKRTEHNPAGLGAGEQPRVNSLQALKFEKRLYKDEPRVQSLPHYSPAFPKITPLGWAVQIQSAFIRKHWLAMGFGSDPKNSVLKCNLCTGLCSGDLRTTDNLTELLKSIRYLSFYRLQHRRESWYTNCIFLASSSANCNVQTVWGGSLASMNPTWNSHLKMCNKTLKPNRHCRKQPNTTKHK